jgi:isopentenyl-diphosphate delta-isomerase
MTARDIKIDMQVNPQVYTAWFKIIFNKYYEYIT